MGQMRAGLRSVKRRWGDETRRRAPLLEMAVRRLKWGLFKHSAVMLTWRRAPRVLDGAAAIGNNDAFCSRFAANAASIRSCKNPFSH
jgi:hypothetical protein